MTSSLDHDPLDTDRAHVDGHHITEPRIVCDTCHNAEPFDGTDQCCACFVALRLADDPCYIVCSYAAGFVKRCPAPGVKGVGS